VQQYHLLGTFKPFGPVEWLILTVIAAALLYWLLTYLRTGLTLLGLIGRLIAAALAIGVTLLILSTYVAGGVPGTLPQTLFYVGAGVTAQFALGLGLALLCAKPIRGRSFFRVLFFIPLMVTPVGIAYIFRMLADMQKGPFSPIAHLLGVAEWSWATDP